MSKVFRLTKRQLEFLDSIFDRDFSTPDMSWECFKHERRTAISLANKGLVFFPSGEPEREDEFFMVGLSWEGVAFMVARSEKNETSVSKG